MAIFFHLILFQMITGSLASTMSISSGFLLIFLICFHILSFLVSWVPLCIPLMTPILFMVSSGKSVCPVTSDIWIHWRLQFILMHLIYYIKKKNDLHFFSYFYFSFLNSNFRPSSNHTYDDISLPHCQLQHFSFSWTCLSQHLVQFSEILGLFMVAIFLLFLAHFQVHFQFQFQKIDLKMRQGGYY